MKNKKLLTVLIILFLGITALFQHYLDINKNFHKEKDIFLALPKSTTLKIISLNYRNFVADMICLWAIQFYGKRHINNRYNFLEMVFNLITDINPHYISFYKLGSWIMALERRDIPMATKLLEKGFKNNPKEWILIFDAGFYYYKYIKDYQTAKKYFETAANVKNAPKREIMNLANHSTYMSGNLEQAWKVWENIEKTAKNKMTKNTAFLHLYQIKFEMDLKKIKNAITEYKKKFLKNPKNLDELVQKKYLSQKPKDYKGDDYLYSQKTGKIKPILGVRWKKSL